MNQASADLAKDMAAAQLKEFGPDPGVATYPSAFFLQDVYVYKGDLEGNEVGSTRTPVNPAYCAKDDAAKRVVEILGGAEITMANPENPAGLQDGWKASRDVPYAIFSRGGVKGNPINVGFGLLNCWTHGVNGDLALQNAVREVEGSFA